MTVQTTENRVNYLGTGSNVGPFAFTFVTLDTDHINVYLDEVLQSSGFVTVLNADQDLTPGGNVTFSVAPGLDVAITIERFVPLTQLIDYQPYDPFPAETHETGLDLGAMGRQQLQDEIDRSLKTGVSTPPGVTYTLPFPDAGKSLIWNQAEDGLENGPDADEISSAQGYAVAAGDSATAAAGSAANALTSENNALASELKAQQWAEEPEDSEVETGQFSALHWAAKSADSAVESAGYVAQGTLWGLKVNRDAINLATINTGRAKSDNNLVLLEHTVAMQKQIDSTFVQGDTNGGLATALTITNGTWYALYMIEKTADGAIDFYWDDNDTATNLPSGWQNPRRIWWHYYRDGTTGIEDYIQRGNDCVWREEVASIGISNHPTSRVLSRMRCPPANVEVNLAFGVSSTTTASATSIRFMSPSVVNEAVNSYARQIYNCNSGSGNARDQGAQGKLWTDASGNIASRALNSNTSTTRAMTISYTDLRGQLQVP